MERLFRRAGLALGMSEGFHPKPRMSFPLALALGMEGLDEVMELELSEPYTAEEVHQLLEKHSIPGLRFVSVDVLPQGTAKAQVARAVYQVSVPTERQGETSERVDRLLSEPTHPIHRPKRAEPLDLKSALEALQLADGSLRMRLRVDRDGSVGPRDVLGALGLDDLEREGCYLTRTQVEIE
jgi:radical SAM-linked protein